MTACTAEVNDPSKYHIVKSYSYAVQSVAFLTAIVLSSGCSSGENQRSPGEAVGRGPLAVLDTILLEEPDTAFLALPTSLGQSAGGDIFVTDKVLGQVFRYDHEGRLLGIIGRKGKGPGEFESPRGLTFVEDSLLVVYDPGQRRLQWMTFDGTLVDSVIELRLALGRMSAETNGVIWLGTKSPNSSHALLRWDPRARDTVSVLHLPDIYTEYPVMVVLGGAVPSVSDSDLAVGFGPYQYVYMADPKTGALRDSIFIPAKRRKRISKDILQMASEGNGGGVLNGAAALIALGVLSSGSIAVIHIEVESRPPVFNAVAWLTVVDASGSPLCVDSPVPVIGESAPIFEFLGDTLLVLDRVDVVDAVQTVVRRFIVRSDLSCP